jgi:hypothetical protein
MARRTSSKIPSESKVRVVRHSKDERLEPISLHPLNLREALGAAMESGAPPEMDRKAAQNQKRRKSKK